MGRLVTVHSFRGGTGKSNLCANLAWLAARRGARVAVLDTDLQSPGVHVVFQCDQDRMVNTLSDFVLGRCEVSEVAIDLTEELDAGEEGGKLYLLPSSMKLEAISRIQSEGYDVGKLNEQLVKLTDLLDLDFVLLDTHPGLNSETMLSAAISDTMIVIVRPDAQDFDGTAVLIEVANKIDVPQVLLVANKVLDELDSEDVRQKIEEAFDHPVVGVLPLVHEIVRMGSQGIFAREYPDHPAVAELERIVATALGGPVKGASA